MTKLYSGSWPCYWWVWIYKMSNAQLLSVPAMFFTHWHLSLWMINDKQNRRQWAKQRTPSSRAGHFHKTRAEGWITPYPFCIDKEERRKQKRWKTSQSSTLKPQALRPWSHPKKGGGPVKVPYLREWHSLLRLCHSSALPAGLHMYTLLNHPSTIWETGRSCCSGVGLHIGSDYRRNKTKRDVWGYKTVKTDTKERRKGYGEGEKKPKKKT